MVVFTSPATSPSVNDVASPPVDPRSPRHGPFGSGPLVSAGWAWLWAELEKAVGWEKKRKMFLFSEKY
jgi:hypothetical protein